MRYPDSSLPSLKRRLDTVPMPGYNGATFHKVHEDVKLVPAGQNQIYLPNLMGYGTAYFSGRSAP